MGKIILTMSVSLDGFFEGHDRNISWHLVATHSSAASTSGSGR